MERGINLGNVLSAPIEGNWAPKVFEQYFIDVKNAGFKNVRIPIDFYGNRTNGSTSSYSKESGTANSYTGNTSDYTVSEAYLDRVEEVINWSLNQNLITVLDFHGSELKSEFLYTFSNAKAEYTNPSSAKRLADLDKFKAIWLAIANRFKNYSHNLIFEVVNEPYFEVSATEMNEINSLIINAIRSTGDNNLTRNIIITGGGENSNNAPLQISDDIINPDKPLDGVNLIPYVTGATQEPPHKAIFLRGGGSKGRYAVRMGDYKIITYNGGRGRLMYNLGKDISEKKNIVKTFPERFKEIDKVREEWSEGLIEPAYLGLEHTKNFKDGQ